MKHLTLFISLSLALFLGAVMGAIFIHIGAKHALILEQRSPYDYLKTIEVITNRINTKSGWKVVAVINQAEEIRQGGGGDIGKMTIIKYCNAHYAKRMLQDDDRKKMAVAMPISIAVYEKSTGETMISVNNGLLSSKIYGGETEQIIEKVSHEVEDILSFSAFKFSRF